MRLFWWALLVSYAAIIFYLSGLEGPPAPSLFPYQDKVFHFVEYIPFGYLTLKAFYPATFIGYFMSICFAFGYAAMDEIHQGLVGRDASLFDWLADVAGILTAFARRLL